MTLHATYFHVEIFFPPEQATELLISDMSTKYSVHQPNKQ